MMDWMLLDGQEAKDRIKSEDHQQQLPNTAIHCQTRWMRMDGAFKPKFDDGRKARA